MYQGISWKAREPEGFKRHHKELFKKPLSLAKPVTGSKITFRVTWTAKIDALNIT